VGGLGKDATDAPTPTPNPAAYCPRLGRTVTVSSAFTSIAPPLAVSAARLVPVPLPSTLARTCGPWASLRSATLDMPLPLLLVLARSTASPDTDLPSSASALPTPITDTAPPSPLKAPPANPSATESMVLLPVASTLMPWPAVTWAAPRMAASTSPWTCTTSNDRPTPV
jgi:hypothetical protein